MIYELNTSDMSEIKWGSKDEDRVIQNIVNLINTSVYEIAYDRTVGMSRNFIDMPQEGSIGTAISEFTDLITEFEPRASLLSVEFINIDDEGKMNLKVVIEIE